MAFHQKNLKIHVLFPADRSIPWCGVWNKRPAAEGEHAMIRSIRPVLEGLETRYAPASIALVPLQLGPVVARIATQPAPTPPRIDWSTPAEAGTGVVTDTPIGSPDI